MKPEAATERMVLVQSSADGYVAQAKSLVVEYTESLGIDLSFQNVELELAEFPGSYVPPHGALLLALVRDREMGCVAMRRLTDEICEMKRLYTRPEARRSGLGARLTNAVIDLARARGYKSMRLDTLPTMAAARGLYQRLGFEPIKPYYPSPVAGTQFLELKL